MYPPAVPLAQPFDPVASVRRPSLLSLLPLSDDLTPFLTLPQIVCPLWRRLPNPRQVHSFGITAVLTGHKPYLELSGQEVRVEVLSANVEAAPSEIGDLDPLAQAEIQIEARIRRSAGDLTALQVQIGYQFLGQLHSQVEELPVKMKWVMGYNAELSATLGQIAPERVFRGRFSAFMSTL